MPNYILFGVVMRICSAAKS